MNLEQLAARFDTIEEYERTPVPQKELKSWKSFLGMYAGEHTAGTEFVIGPLFVVHGVAAADLFLGLLVGNFLAVLSWAFICAPIATKTRITLYYQLKKICGQRLASIYDVVNGLMFCFLAGSMIAVSATAVGIPFGIPMPELGDWLPTSVGWVVTVFLVGLIVTVVAIFGYDYVSRVANICAPWMILVFPAAAIAVLPSLGVTSMSDFWTVAQEKIWTGIPVEGQSKFTFWHVTFFAWFCNMAMHIGLADMSVLRYAKNWKAGFTTAAGVYLGHFVAWISSGILCAAALGTVAPGPIAYASAGIAGALCVVIAGWTTSNPTIYRAGLAFQAIVPNFKRWKVTLFTGLITTIAACFPALVMKLLDFVALYGLVLMPMGAVIFMDYYFSNRLRLAPNLAEAAGIKFNWAAGLTWFGTLIICLLIHLLLGVDIFFLGLPGWFIAAISFIVLNKVYQSRLVLATSGE